LVDSVQDPEAFAVFYRRHVRGVLAFFRRRVDSPEVAFDLMAETFAAALEAAPRYEPRPSPLAAGCTGSLGTGSTRHIGTAKPRTRPAARCGCARS